MEPAKGGTLANAPGDEKASDCIARGNYESMFPQCIPIVDDLKQIAGAFEE